MKTSLPVHFYIEKSLYPATLPDDAKKYWDWFCSEDRSYQAWHIYHWVLRPFIELRDRGMNVGLINYFPREGVVFAHRFSIPDNFIPSKNLYLVCILADKRQPGDPGPHPYAQAHIVQNPLEEKIVEGGYYIPLWAQPGIKPRSKERGQVFTNVAYFGSEKYLEPKALEFVKQGLSEIGVNFIIRGRELRHQWHDYSEIDGVLAFRDFNDKRWSWKPATKLYNAWLAEVPAILNPEPAFRLLRKSSLDYIEVKDAQEIVAAITTLKNDPNLRFRMVENAKVRAQEFLPEKITDRWIDYIQMTAEKKYAEWQRGCIRRLVFIGGRKLAVSFKRLRLVLSMRFRDLRIKLKIRTRFDAIFRKSI